MGRLSKERREGRSGSHMLFLFVRLFPPSSKSMDVRVLHPIEERNPVDKICQWFIWETRMIFLERRKWLC